MYRVCMGNIAVVWNGTCNQKHMVCSAAVNAASHTHTSRCLNHPGIYRCSSFSMHHSLQDWEQQAEGIACLRPCACAQCASSTHRGRSCYLPSSLRDLLCMWGGAAVSRGRGRTFATRAFTMSIVTAVTTSCLLAWSSLTRCSASARREPREAAACSALEMPAASADASCGSPSCTRHDAIAGTQLQTIACEWNASLAHSFTGARVAAS